MLDRRVYRAAFLPLLLALFVVAFSLERRPAPATSVLAADAFDGARAFGTSNPPLPDSLRELAASFPDRPPGSAGDEELGARVAARLRSGGFEVSRRSGTNRPVGGRGSSDTVVGVRPGVSSRRIVVVADRASLDSPGLARLSSTAALLEFARIFRTTATREPNEDGSLRAVGRDLRRTLVLVSTSGASLGGGSAGAEAIADVAGPVGDIDAVLALGDLAGGRVRKPWVVPWSNGDAAPPIGLRRTVEAAVRAEVGSPPGGPRATGQWARRAVPLTVSEQGEPAAAGLPAVLLQVSGEQGPSPQTRVTAARLESFGRAALRAVSAVDEIGAPTPGSDRRAPPDGGPAAFAGETNGIVTMRRVLPDWAVRLLVGTMLLPALFAALDAFFRVRRRRLPAGRWMAWAASRAVPFLLAYGWLRILALAGALDAPAAPVLPAAVPLDALAAVSVLSAGLVLALGWFAVRRVVPTDLGDPAAGGAVAAIGTGLGVVVLAVWIVNPYAAVLLVPAAHLWLVAGDPASRLSRPPAVAAVALGLLAPALVALHYAFALDLNPLELAWLAVLVVAGGHVSLLAALAASLVLGCLIGTVVVLSARSRQVRTGDAAAEEDVRTRGPLGYAGPGSLGGTKSALRR